MFTMLISELKYYYLPCKFKYLNIQQGGIKAVITITKQLVKTKGYNIIGQEKTMQNKKTIAYKLVCNCNNTVNPTSLELNENNNTDKSQLIVHPNGIRLGDFRSSIVETERPPKSVPHGTAHNELHRLSLQEHNNKYQLSVQPEEGCLGDFSSSIGVSVQHHRYDKSAPHCTPHSKDSKNLSPKTEQQPNKFIISWD
jgi:hypothetical protein